MCWSNSNYNYYNITGTIFWAMIDRITLREISEGKLLLLAYIMRDNSVTPLGSALYDDGSIDIGQLLDATSLTKPIFYKEKDNKNGYKQGKNKEEGGTCVEGDHFMIRFFIKIFVRNLFSYLYPVLIT